MKLQDKKKNNLCDNLQSYARKKEPTRNAFTLYQLCLQEVRVHTWKELLRNVTSSPVEKEEEGV